MKLENQQTYVTNLQFGGGRNIGKLDTSIGQTSATASLAFAGIANTTGSFRLTDTFGVTNLFWLTASDQTTANLNATSSVEGSTFYISISGSTTAANKVTAIANFLNVSASVIVSASAATTNLQLTSSINGTAGNNVYVTSGSTTTNLQGGTGNSQYPYSFPFVAGGLYVGVPGNLTLTALDGTVMTLVSASGFIPGLVQSVDSSSTAYAIVAFK